MSDENRQLTESERVSRRGFLRRGSGVVAGTALAGVVIPSVHAAGDETIKVALIGCGGRGTGAVTQALSTKGSVKLWAMADVFEDRLESSLKALSEGQESRYDREKHQGFSERIDVSAERRFIGFDAFKKAIDSGIDLAILTTYPHFRPEHFEYAAGAGVNVFMEKPVAVDGPGIRRLLAANKVAKQKNLKVGVGLQRHHHLVYRETLKRLHDGMIGDPQTIRVYWNSHFPAGVLPRENQTEMEFQLRNQYPFTWLSGDHIVEQHIHNIDIATWIMQGKHPLEANGMGGRAWRNGREHGEIFDHHFVEFTYEDGTKMFSQCRHIPNTWTSVSEHVQGTKGTAEINKGIIRAADGRWRFREKNPNPYQVEHDVLADAIRNDKPHNEADYGAIATMTAIMGRMATYSGKLVTWDQAFNSELALKPDRYAWDGTPPAVPDEDGVYPCAIPGTTKAF